MAFINLAALTAYVNSNLNTNGMDAITGAQLNTTMNGVIQFLNELSLVTDGVQELTLGAGMSGEGTNILDTGTVALPVLGASAVYGDGTHVPKITIDTFGRITAVVNTLITAGGGGTFDIGLYSTSGISTSYTIATGLSYTPRFGVAVPLDTHTGSMFVARNIFYTFSIDGLSINFASTPTAGTLTMAWITFE